MKLVSWNVNGLRACQKKGFLDFFEREKPDILCLQETKAHPKQLDQTLVTPLSYKSYWTSCSIRKGYSGVVTYTHLPVSCVNHGIGLKKFDEEGRFIITEIEDILLYNVYFPNGSAREERHLFKQEFLKKFLRHLMKTLITGKKIIVVGDYNVAHKNIDVYDPIRLSKESGFLPEEQKWFSDFLDAGFMDTFRYFHPNAKDCYSWWSYREMARIANRGWRIDHICVSENLRPFLKNGDIWDQQEGSDHCPVMLEFDL